LLQRYLPTGNQPVDPRGFEWRYLWNLCRDQSVRSFTNFEGPVSFTWLPDHESVVTGSGHLAKRLDLKSGQETELLRDPDDWICTLALCPTDSNLLATGGDAKQVKIWDLAAKRLLASFPGHRSAIHSLAFSPNGRLLASAAFDTPGICLWDIAQRTNRWMHDTELPGEAVVFAADGRNIYSGGGKNAGNILQWDLQGHVTAFPVRHQGWVYELALSPDGSKLASASSDGTTIVWDLSTRTPLRRMDSSGSLGFSLDGHLLAIGGSEAREIWDLGNDAGMTRLIGQRAGALVLSFSRDGRQLIAGSADRTLKVWSVVSGPAADSLHGHSNWITTSITFSPDGKLLASANFHSPYFTRLWDVASRQPITDLLGPQGSVAGISFSPNGTYLATGSFDRRVHLWNARTRHLERVLTNDFDGGYVAFGRDSRLLAVAQPGFVSGGKRLAFYQLPSGQQIQKLRGYETNATAVTFGHQSDLLAIGYVDGTVRLWNHRDERLLREFKLHSNTIWFLAFNADDSLLASAGEDARVGLYNVQTKQAYPPLNEHTGTVWVVAFSPDGRTLASASNDSTVKLWNLAALSTGETRTAALTLRGHHGPVTGVAFAPDAKLMATGGADGVIRFWPAPSFE
jgi:WD40 repeat protein